MDLEWTAVPSHNDQDDKQRPSIRGYHTASYVNSALYVFGGNGHECCLNDLYVCRFAAEEVPSTKGRTMSVPRCHWHRCYPEGPAPKARRSHHAVVVGDHIVIFGGFNNEWQVQPLDLHMLDTVRMCWSFRKTSAAGPKGRAGSSVDVVNGVIYMIGGNLGDRRTNEVLAMPTHTLHAPMWTVLHPQGTPPQERSAHTTAVVGTNILVFGGWNGVEDFNDLHIFDTERVAWKTVQCTSGAIPRPCSGHWAVPLLDKVILFGGQVDTGDSFIDDMYMFQSESDTFHRIRPFNVNSLPIRSGHSVTKVDSQRALIFGGWNGEDFTSDIYFLKLSSMRSDVANMWQ
eukprot:gb/GECH01013579.1/.p1 GENE.gb/GECH01013579.1/~~gb/GECH01013579.1/.p1  ORF type:complete len:343 (+),score=58.08 gb/GECH01013579.1/:1-1029(+)